MSKIHNYFKDDKKSAIILAIQLYGPIRLKLLSTVIGKSEATILHHLKQLVSDEIITVDSFTSAGKRGKFYVLSRKAEQIFNEQIQSQIDSLPETSSIPFSKNRREIHPEGFIQKIIDRKSHFELTSTINWNIEKFVVQYIKALEKKIDTGFSISDKIQSNLRPIQSIIYSFNLNTRNDVFEFEQLIFDFIKKLYEFSLQTKSKGPLIPPKQYIYLFTSPLSNFDLT